MEASATGFARVTPVSGELTASWYRRLARAYGLPPQDLLRAVLTGPLPARITGTPGTGTELFLSAAGRESLSTFSGIPRPRLAELLPQFDHPRPRQADDDAAAHAAWYAPCRNWVTGCTGCTARAQTGLQPVLIYTRQAGHICPRHRRWLLADPRQPAAVDLTTLPEIIHAHRRHTALVETHPHPDAIVGHAAAVVWSWQAQGWAKETVWARRTQALTEALHCDTEVVAAHPLITYPETVEVARLVGSTAWQHRLRKTAAEHGAAAATTQLRAEIARRCRRPWLADWLAATSETTPRRLHPDDDPLQHWLHTLLAGSQAPENEAHLWAVTPQAHRPNSYSDRTSFLCTSRPGAVTDQARTLALTDGWQPPRPLRAPQEAR